MKYLPNTLSILRIILAFGLLFIHLNSFLFIMVYLLCGISDVADGYIARKFGFESVLGIKLIPWQIFFGSCCSFYICSYN